MGRPAGSRNPDFEATRASLVRAVQARLATADGVRASFRELAAAAGVSVATLRHYFGSREGVIAAVMSQWHQMGQRYMLEVATGPLLPVRASLAWFLDFFALGFRMGVGDIHAIGLAAGLREPTLGPTYLCQVLDPSLEAIEARLARHVARGELRPGDVRHMALSLVSPALLALLHQGPLGGEGARPLAWERFCSDHLESFLRAFGTGYEAPAEPGARTTRGEDLQAPRKKPGD
jgi:AcrR family transcriptional regulator